MHLPSRALSSLFAMLALGSAGCVHSGLRLYAPMQPDGWSAQPVSITRRFTAEAVLDPDTRTPVGDEGYSLSILTKAGAWDYGSTRSFLLSHARQPWGHSWLILESPENRLECGLNGNFGREKPRYGEGIRQRIEEGDPNPIAYLWVTMSDGQIELGNGNRTPTFVWQMPITRQQHERIHDHVLQWEYSQIGVRTNNCVDLVTEAAELAGISLVHRIRLTLPPVTKILGQTLQLWTDPQYRILGFSTPDLLEMDLRQLARFGIGRDVTQPYLASNRAAPKSKDGGIAGDGNAGRAEDGQ